MGRLRGLDCSWFDGGCYFCESCYLQIKLPSLSLDCVIDGRFDLLIVV
jgi:hypothetical protein